MILVWDRLTGAEVVWNQPTVPEHLERNIPPPSKYVTWNYDTGLWSYQIERHKKELLASIRAEISTLSLVNVVSILAALAANVEQVPIDNGNQVVLVSGPDVQAALVEYVTMPLWGMINAVTAATTEAEMWALEQQFVVWREQNP